MAARGGSGSPVNDVGMAVIGAQQAFFRWQVEGLRLRRKEPFYR
jgi:hypothetical protein